MALLEAKAITMDFGGVRAVDHVDLAVEKGTILGIIGPNGSGKTTFFNVLTGIYCPTGGQFLFEGRDVTGWAPHQITQSGIARTFQNIRLFRNMSVLENVLVGRHTRLGANLAGVLLRTRGERDVEIAAREKARELLAFVGLADREGEYAANLAYGPGVAACVGPHLQILFHGGPREDTASLRGLRDAPSDDFCRGKGLNPLVEELDHSRGRPHEPGDRVEKRTLAGSVVPDKGHNVPVLHLYRDTSQGVHVTVVRVKIRYL